MIEDDTLFEQIQICPTEIFLYIFTFLKPKQLANCRQVCRRWRYIVDSLYRSELFWLDHCKNDFSDIYKAAYHKCKPQLSWNSLYRSLSLWSKLNDASEIHDEFASASCSQDEIRDFQILRYGEIGVHTRGGIVYYNVETFTRSNREIISGDYLRYVENDDVMLILAFNLDLFILRKIIRSPRHESDTSFPSVKNFLLNDNEVYFVTLNNEIHVCRLRDEKMESDMLGQLTDGIMCLGHKSGNLHALTFHRDIYTIYNKQFIFQYTLNDSPNLLHALHQFNFLEHLDWRVYYQWMFVLNRSIPQTSIRDIIVVKIYGDVVFVGSNWGVFRVYYSPYSNNEFDIFNTEPVKQYNFMERRDCPVLSNSPIIQIDVIEGEDSHMVLVGMPKKIAVLNFNHSIKRTTSLGKLTLDEVQDGKIVTIIE